MSKQSNLDRLAQLHPDNLHAVVEAVESAILTGMGWLIRRPDGMLESIQPGLGGTPDDLPPPFDQLDDPLQLDEY